MAILQDSFKFNARITNVIVDAKEQSIGKKLHLWKLNLQKNEIGMFPLFNSCTRVNVKAIEILFV